MTATADSKIEKLVAKIWKLMDKSSFRKVVINNTTEEVSYIARDDKPELDEILMLEDMEYYSFDLGTMN